MKQWIESALIATLDRVRARRSEFLICAALLAACLAGLAWSLVLSPRSVLLILALLSLSPLFAAWHTARSHTMVHPFALFACAYSAYNGVLLLRYSFVDVADFPYPITIIHDTVIKAASLSALGALAIVAVWLLRSHDASEVCPLPPPASSQAAFRVGFLFWCIAFVLYFIQVEQIGGFFTVLATSRVERFTVMRDVVSTPYPAFAAASAAFMFCGSEGHRGRRRFAWFAVLCWLILVGLMGERRSMLQILLVVAAVLAAYHPARFALRRTTVTLALLLIVSAIAFGQLRELIQIFVNRDPVESAIVLSRHQKLQDWFLPENTEIAGPYVAILYATVTEPHISWGHSYASSLPSFVPRALYPGTKPQDRADALARSLHPQAEFPMGWGYNPVAEAYENFGYLGVPVALSAWAILFLWLGRFQGRSLISLLLAATLLQEAINVNRSDFREVYLESFFCVCAVLLGTFIMRCFPSGRVRLTWR